MALRPDLTSRAVGFTAATAVHLAAGLLLFSAARTLGDHHVRNGEGSRSGSLVVQLLPLSQSDPNRGAAPTPAPESELVSTVETSAPRPHDMAQLVSAAVPATAAPPSLSGTAVTPAAVSTTADFGGSDAARFRDALLAHILRYKRYPAEARSNRQQAVAWVRFLMHRDGSVSRVWISQGSGAPLLDEEAVASVRRAAPLPVIPANLPDRIDVELPIDFAID